LEYNQHMARNVIHISEAEAGALNVATLLAHVHKGAEVVIENGAGPVAVISPAAPPRRKISEILALMAKDSPAVMDASFARDVEAAVASHREPLEPPAWD